MVRLDIKHMSYAMTSASRLRVWTIGSVCTKDGGNNSVPNSHRFMPCAMEDTRPNARITNTSVTASIKAAFER